MIKRSVAILGLALSLTGVAASASESTSFSSYEGITSEQSCFAPPFDDADTVRQFAVEFSAFPRQAVQGLFSEQLYSMRQQATECVRFTYDADGVEVAGFMLRPANVSEDTPVLVYHRGGNGDFAAINLMNLHARFFDLASEGYIVIGSNLREQDEFGGADVEDSRRILDIVKGMDNVDLDRIALWGESRGATQMMQTARGRDDIHALVFAMGSADSERALQTRPEMTRVYQMRVPDFAANREQALRERSVVHWVDEVPDVPVLILHGDQDTNVDVEQAHILADALDEQGREYTLKIYEGVAHSMRGEPTDDMFAWLEEVLNR